MHETKSAPAAAERSPMLTGIETLIGLAETQLSELESLGGAATRGDVGSVRGVPAPATVADQMEDLELYVNRLRQIHEWLRADPRLLPLVDDAIGKQVRALERRQSRQNVTLAVVTTVAGAILGWAVSLLGTPVSLLHAIAH